MILTASCKRTRPAPRVDFTAAKQADDHCVAVRSKGRTEEARAWLRAADPSHPRRLGEHTQGATAELVEDLYARGASKVEVAQIQATEHGEWSNVVLVAIPDDPKLRAQVFGFEVDYSSEFDPTEDVGQRCLFLFKFKGRLVRPFVGG